jgi:class 3 adenylate cyclase/CheY-like chemotaxis protein
VKSATEPRPVVLVADDDEQIRALFEELLDSAGFEVLLAENGTRALELAVRNDPDVVLLDVNMPAPDGYETTRRLNLHEKTGGTPVVLMSGAGDRVDRVRALRAGAVDFLLKPVHAEELQAKMQSLLRLRRYNQSLRRSGEELALAAAEQAGSVEQALAAFARFVPREMLECLDKSSVLEVRLGDQVLKEMAVLFSDIRSFTALSEKMTPQENFNFLNSYLKRMNPYIWENHGFIDKYIGDAIMALFPGGAEDALRAALGMIRHIPVYNLERATFGYDPIRIGIGLHAGPVMLGMIGHERFMQATVISDAVNLASRMERLTKLYGVALLLSSPVVFGLTDPTRYAYRFLDKIRVRGKDEPVSVFEVFDADPPETVAHKIRTRDRFEKGVFEYHRNNVEEAARLFAAIATAEGGDRPLEIYRERCAYYKEFGIRKDVITEEGF